MPLKILEYRNMTYNLKNMSSRAGFIHSKLCAALLKNQIRHVSGSLKFYGLPGLILENKDVCSIMKKGKDIQ